ncbi:MAG TPA: hypothetical protein VIL49_02090, partial [Capillimicrobium sp.]
MPAAAALALLAAAVPAPQVDLPTGSHLVSTPDGQRLALVVGVRAAPVAGRTTVRLRATVRLPSGANLRPTPSTRQHAGTGTVEHVVLFSPASTARLARMARRPELVVRAFTAADGDGDGAAERTSAPTIVAGRLPRLRRSPPVPRPGAGAPIGDDPCAGEPAERCVAVAGEPWSAAQRWAVRAWRLECPAGT